MKRVFSIAMVLSIACMVAFAPALGLAEFDYHGLERHEGFSLDPATGTFGLFSNGQDFFDTMDKSGKYKKSLDDGYVFLSSKLVGHIEDPSKAHIWITISFRRKTPLNIERAELTIDDKLYSFYTVYWPAKTLEDGSVLEQDMLMCGSNAVRMLLAYSQAKSVHVKLIGEDGQTFETTMLNDHESPDSLVRLGSASFYAMRFAYDSWFFNGGEPIADPEYDVHDGVTITPL